MKVLKIDHRAVRTTKLEESRHFYEDLLGLERGHRPEALPTEGYWLYAESQPIIHLVEDPSGIDDGVTPRDDLVGVGGETHVALTVVGARDITERLMAEGVTYWDRLFRDPVMYQVFVEDPNGLLIELIDRNPGDIDGPICKIVDK